MVSRHIRSRVGEVVIGALLLAMMAYAAAIAIKNYPGFMWSIQEWQVALLVFACLVIIAWGYRMLIGPPHYHPDMDDKSAKLRVAHVDLDTGEVVKRELLTPRQVRRRFLRP